jgi:hypothetical protein
MRHETSVYYAGGALTGSAFRSVNNEISPHTRREIVHRFCNVFAGAGLAYIGTYATRETSDLTDPAILQQEYGLSAYNAEQFCNDFRDLLSRKANAGGATAGLLQELLIPAPRNDVSIEPK